jgi:hypothetical protein
VTGTPGRSSTSPTRPRRWRATSPPRLSQSSPRSLAWTPWTWTTTWTPCLSSDQGTARVNGIQYVRSSVADPNPDPSNPYVFGPPGFGSVFISQRHGSRSGSFYHQATKVRKTLIPIVLLLLVDFLSLKNDVNVPSKSNKQKNVLKKLVFCWLLEGQ